MVRFLHTSDWQLGMTRHFLAGEAQARFSQDRVEVIERIGALALDEDCEFVVVAGDVFESNQIARRTVVRTLEALRKVPVPVFLLPGNHDPHDASSVYRGAVFRDAAPEHVHVLGDREPVEVRPGVEVVGAPWFSRRPLGDLAGEAAARLDSTPGVVRVLVAHGAVDLLSPDAEDPALIRLADLEAALESGRVRYVALGDRHSTTRVGASGRVWYSGTPEPTDYRETEPGRVLVVTVEADGIEVAPHEVARWRFLTRDFPLSSDEDLDALEEWLDGRPDKALTALKVSFTGTLNLAQKSRHDALLDRAADLFAAVVVRARTTDLVVIPEDSDFADLDLSGFALETTEALRERAADDETARDALALLVRLSGRGG